MRLPKRALPQYTIHLPVSKVDVKYRPHTVKEEQIINMAQMSDEDSDKLNAIFQIVANCTDYDTETLYPAEVELLFMRIRATSDTPKIPIEYTIMPEFDKDGKNIHADCGETIKSAFDIVKDVEIVFDEDKMKEHAELAHDGGWIIDVGDGVKLKLRIRPIANGDETALYELVECIIDEKAVDEETGETYEAISYKGEDYNMEEFMEWVNDMPSSAFNSFSAFMAEMPKCMATLRFKCRCGQVIEETEAGILSFLV